MTAINMMVQPKARAGFIISDGAHTDAEGRMTDNLSKIIHGAGRFPWACGVTGNVHPSVVFQAIAEAQPLTLKQLERRLPDCVRRAVKLAAEHHAMPESDVTLCIRGCAWDFARKRPIGFVVTNAPWAYMPDAEAFVFYETDANVTMASDGTTGGPWSVTDLSDPVRFDPEVDGLAMIEAHRRDTIPSTTPGAAQAYRIGGDVDLTRVTKHGVQVWKVHEWPDVVGELIVPADQRLTPPSPAMTISPSHSCENAAAHHT